MSDFELSRFVVDLVVGSITERALEPAVDRAWRALKGILLPLYDPAFASVRLSLQEHIERERAKDEAFLDRLKRSLQSGEAPALAAHFIREAAQATTQERMRMLAAAAAGVFVPDLDSEMRSRVARAMAQLEPGDVRVLRRLADGKFGGTPESVERALGPSRGALEATGCILVRPDDEELVREFEDLFGGARPELRTIASIAALGHAVLRSLSNWKPGTPAGTV